MTHKVYSRLDIWSKVHTAVSEAMSMAKEANDTLLERRLGNMLEGIPNPISQPKPDATRHISLSESER